MSKQRLHGHFIKARLTGFAFYCGISPIYRYFFIVHQKMGIHVLFYDQLDEQIIIFTRSLNARFVLYGILGEFSEEQSARFWQKLLALNSGLAKAGEGSIALEKSADGVMMIKTAPTNLTVSELAKEVNVFISHIERLMTVLKEEGLIFIDPLVFMKYKWGRKTNRTS